MDKSLRYYQRFTLIQKIKTFYLGKDVREGRRIYKDDVERFNHLFLDQVKSVLLEKVLTGTQLNHLLSLKNKKQFEIDFDLMIKAALWEIAYSNDVYKGIEQMFGSMAMTLEKDTEIKKFYKNIQNALGIKTLIDEEKSKNIQWYRYEIIKTLETTEEMVGYILDEIKKPCEYDSVLGSIQNCSYVSSLPKRDRKAIYEAKQKFERVKQKTIEGLKFLNLPYDEVEKKQYASKEEFGWVNYEMTLKHIKRVLYDDLTIICGTGKNRANMIIKILEYI